MEQPADVHDVQALPGSETPKQKPLRTRLWIAIPMAILFLAIGAVIYFPAGFLGGMMTDSCSGDSNAYLLWQIWLIYLWPVILFAGAILPPIFVIQNRRWKWVLLSMAAGLAASILWYILWFPLLMIFGGC